MPIINWENKIIKINKKRDAIINWEEKKKKNFVNVSFEPMKFSLLHIIY